VNPKRQRERESSVRHYIYGETYKFNTTKVPMQCPFVLLIKVGWRRGKTFGSREGRDEKWNKERS
jgi:hypothetical protein